MVLASYETVLKERGLFQVCSLSILVAFLLALRCGSVLLLLASRWGARMIAPAALHTLNASTEMRQGIVWETVIIDEAHRMKSTGSSTRSVIANMPIGWLLLLTGACCALLRMPSGCLLLC